MSASAGSPHVGLVVEGAGETPSVPLLLRRHLELRGHHLDLLGKPVPLHGRGNATTPGGLEGYVATAARPGCIGVMVFIDSDGDCVADLGTSLAARARATVGVPVHIVAAESTFEDWLYASAESLMLDLAYEPGTRGLGAIQRALAPVKYIKPVWQPRLTARLDIAMATERNASLRRALARFDELVDHHFGLS